MNSALASQLQSHFGPVAAGVLLALTAVLVALVARKLVRSLRARRRAARSVRGERRAAALLAAHGFRVLDAQLSLTYAPVLGGQPFPVLLRADYLVSRRGKRYVAEVKTGERAPSLAHAPTRRQLLEYSVAFDVDGVLLVDVEAGLVQDVEFPRGGLSASGWRLGPLVALAALLLAAALFAHRLGMLRGSESRSDRSGRDAPRALWSPDER
ncbi:MAG: hypothetical protein H6725_12120 [Sandaracinaceae bacterium]|nr:hypothetical protein [Sandaracinaceae bacterium]